MLKKILWAIGAVFGLLIFLAIITPTPPEGDLNQEETNSSDVVSSQPVTEVADTNEQPQPEPSSTEANEIAKKPTYEIVYSKSNHRYDGATAYWVLIDPVDISSDEFKNDIATIIREIVTDKGSKISLSIFDKKASLDINYKLYGNNSLGRATTQAENDEAARHLIAMFDGDFAGNFQYENEISYFPSAIKSTPEVGGYVGTEELK